MRRILPSVFGAALIAAVGTPLYCSAAATNAQDASPVITAPLAGPTRPSTVPDGYVVTPFGFFHPSCVQSLAKGERLLADGRVQHANGSVNALAAVCRYPHYMRNGVAAAATRSSPPTINGWVESASITTGSLHKSYGALITGWIVPRQPYADDGQTLFFFPGFEEINDAQTSILQPVLGWYGGQWTIASWNCCLSGIATNSPPEVVKAGDVIYGSITNGCQPGTVSCASWNVLTVDLSTGQSTTLGNTPSQGQVFNWAFGGVLEAYSVSSCDDYPKDPQLTFDQVTVFDENLRPLDHEKWSIAVDTTDAPQCRYGIDASERGVKVKY
jgi:hypothetical protein